ncbi:MAG: mechanosensitive ion channel protein MscS [Flavobacteriaceae bacterium CG_4_8_14_3_um_filter_34_10]|nr:mechanosensitive ion channel [Flavobacteriia bacterium]OIP52759.1 MAG: mechanosensitive ion channel protein MscS [Flavobacteriaceae bacterium CG2_30_34_30]PIQ17704.1 MAG: mechanosensitive ion channel protein MscS [Flavobacteriaceae bacterium CG18_big_fil_WC_8_21_14_2_50_34_36]PIV50323.1 MAG: mechanosensitive ion channel protein MscS [Flavobacteriaceae bacterium CG02_land_8_20_14_3_00_34_13]PIX10218.1 MAG: mechanosensitive ion channel protein MscS [Flavobacteriaceae bacterium CG_4_8_14_3_um_f
MNTDFLITQIIYSAIALVVLIIARSILIGLVRSYARKIERLEQRTNLIVKYIDFAIIFLIVFVFILIWGVDFRDIGLVFSSVFAIIGVAFFAQWSILSNVTSGIIMFFTFPYKIGDRIKIHDKEFVADTLTIEDIRTFQVILRTDTGEILSYPNNLMLQKGVTLISATDHYRQDNPLNMEEKNLTKTHD